MIYLTLLLAIIFLLIAHIFKIFRMRKFIEIYEEPVNSYLYTSLSLGYFVNFLAPFRLGDILRVVYMGKQMKNGYSFAFTIVLIDRILDFFMVFIIFAILTIIYQGRSDIFNSFIFYLIISIILVIALCICYKHNKYIKKIIKKIASIFNDKIELNLLTVSWCLITSIKDLILKIDKLKIIFYTIIMWCFYIGSYVLIGYTLNSAGTESDFLSIFLSLFSRNSLDVATSLISVNYLMFIYLLVPLFVMLVLSKLSYKQDIVKTEYLNLLPQIKAQDKLFFLEGYFEAENREYFNKYINFNRDISILEDYSAGSNATTMLCMKDGIMFFRKYSFGDDSKKLKEQIDWLLKHQEELKVTKVINVLESKNYISYDMPYYNSAISLFNYIHSSSLQESWSLIEKVLIELDNNLHKKSKKTKSSDRLLNEYINDKVIENIKKIEKGSYIKDLLKYDYLIINSKKYHNLNYFKEMFTDKYLKDIFKDDYYTDIHGDFTIENIICLADKQDFYIIDPNTGNKHNTPFLDYSKLLQSLHGGYEFLMSTKAIEIKDNNINYLKTRSASYDEIYKKYDAYLEKKFSQKELKSIYYHEIVHWLRLLPYKIKKDGKRSVLFYAGLIIVMNEIYERFK